MSNEEFWENAYRQDVTINEAEVSEHGLYIHWSWPTVGFGELRLKRNPETGAWDACTERMSDRCVAHIMAGFAKHVLEKLNNMG